MRQSYTFQILEASIYKLIFKGSRKISLLLFVFLFAFTLNLQAQTLPQEITYQGKLVQDGIPFSGSTTMIFELINPTTNAIEWTETQTINVQDGLYSVVLGAQTPFTPNFFSQNPSLGLRVSVNGNPLTPITVLRAVPYAHAAGSVADNSVTSVQITNGTIQTIDIATGGQNKILATDANGQVVWIDRASVTTPIPNLQQVLGAGNSANEIRIINLATPTDSQDAANKAYVDASTGASSQDLSTDATLLISGSGTYNGSTTETISVADGGITDGKLANNAVTTNKIANDAVTTDKIIDGTIRAEDIQANDVDEVLLSNGSTVAWTPITSLPITETDPKVGSLTNDVIPVWNGISLEDGSITDAGGDVEVNPSADFSVNAGGQISLNSSSGNIAINSVTTTISQDLTVTQNATINNDLLISGVVEIDANPFDEVITQSEVASFSSSDAQIMTGAAITDYVATEISSITETDPKVGAINNNTIPFWNGTQLVDGSITDDGTNLSTAGTFTFSNSSPIIYNNGSNNSTLNFEPLTANNIITFPNASGTVLLDGSLANNFDNGLAILSTDASKIGLGGVLVEPVLISGFDGSVYHNFELVNMDSIGFQANDFINLDADTIEMSTRTLDMGVTGEAIVRLDAANSAFSIQDNSANELFSLRNSNTNVFDLEVNLGETGNFFTGGISLTAQRHTSANEGSSLYLGGGTNGMSGGSAFLNGGGSDGGIRGKVFLQSSGGMVEIGGDGFFTTTDSELKINGWLNLPSLDPPPTSLTPNFFNLLYADNNGDLFWGNQNLSQGGTIWQRENATQIYYNGTLGNTQVGIGNFNSASLPSANLHIRRIGQEADLRIATLVNAANLTSASQISLRTARNNADNEDDILNNQLVGKILFEGYNGGSFAESGRIDVLLADASTFENEMRFFVNGNERMNINGNEVEIIDTDFTISNALQASNLFSLDNQPATDLFNFTVNLGTTTDPSANGGQISLTSQSSTGSGGQGGNINIFAGQGTSQGGNINLTAGGSPLTTGSVSIDGGFASGPNTIGFVRIQSAGGGNVIVGNGGSNDSQLQLNGLINMADFGGSPPTSGNFLYASSGDLFWGSTQLNAESVVSAGNGLTETAGFLNLGGTLTDNVLLNGNTGSYSIDFLNLSAFRVTTSNRIEFSAFDGAAGFNFSENSGITDANINADNFNVNLGTTINPFGGSVVLNSQDVNGGNQAGASLEVGGANADAFRGGGLFLTGGFSDDYQGATLILSGGEGSSMAGGNVTLNGGGGSGIKGTVFLQSDGGDVVIGNASSTTTVNGNLIVNGTYSNPSDARYKKQINTLDNSLSNIISLRGANYYWKDENKDQRLQFGVIAQELEEVFPNLVHTNSDGYKSVNYIGLVPVLIEATKEQQTIIDNQKEEIQTQKTELEALKNQINELKQIVASLQENENSNENSNSALAQKVETLEKQLTALVESLSNKTETTQTASLKEEE